VKTCRDPPGMDPSRQTTPKMCWSSGPKNNYGRRLGVLPSAVHKDDEQQFEKRLHRTGTLFNLRSDNR
jgi:hypothetical protein